MNDLNTLTAEDVQMVVYAGWAIEFIFACTIWFVIWSVYQNTRRTALATEAILARTPKLPKAKREPREPERKDGAWA